MINKNIDFGYLIEQMYMPLSKTHSEMIEQYKDLPMCLIECVDDGERSEQIRIDFEKENSCVYYFFNKDSIPELACLCFDEPSDTELFVVFLLRYADYYDYVKNHWVIKECFFVRVEQEENSIHFICRRFVN